MKYYLLLFLSFLIYSASAQQRTYLDKKFNHTSDSASAKFYLVSKPAGKNQVLRQMFMQPGKLVSEEAIDPRTGTRNGARKEWHETTGNRRLIAHYKAGQLHGPFETYFPNGKLRRDEFYKKGRLISGKCFSRTGKDTTYYAFETPPVFPGGNQQFYSYLKSHLNHLSKKENRLMQRASGQALVTFYVESDGKVSNARIVKGIYPRLDKEVLKIITKMPRWNPARQEDTSVKVLFTLPIMFN